VLPCTSASRGIFPATSRGATPAIILLTTLKRSHNLPPPVLRAHSFSRCPSHHCGGWNVYPEFHRHLEKQFTGLRPPEIGIFTTCAVQAKKTGK